MNAKPREIHKPGEENFEPCIDESEVNYKSRRLAGPKVEDMFARSMAWQYLKQFGVKRPKVVRIEE